LIRLPFAFQCFMPPADAPAVAPPPCRIKGYITFGCFNKPAKLNAAVLTTWARLLQRLPDARLLLKSSVFADPDLCEVFWQRFELLGVSRQRVMLRGASSYLVMLADYAEVDIALDPFPFSGGATTCDALWMGLPMITLRGERFAANHTVSHLIASGFPQWIAEDEAAYVDIAARLAAELLDDPASLGELRATQRSLMAASPLCDAKSYMVRVELELRRLWRAHCAMRLG
jgi:predicted O-linked N-acetylglucosamine transferase (SPINDLY family)